MAEPFENWTGHPVFECHSKTEPFENRTKKTLKTGLVPISDVDCTLTIPIPDLFWYLKNLVGHSFTRSLEKR
jgi:hypothetical protein